MILAIDIGGTKFAMAVFDGVRMVRRESRATDAQGGREWMLKQIAGIVSRWKQEFPILGCGIGFGGPVNFAAQRVVLSTHVGGWRDFDLCDFVRSLIGGPVVMDNDANVGALGEAKFGAGKGCSPLFYMTLSTGIGGGIYADGQVWRGADSYGGEIGHLTIRPEGPECLCGARGCYERMCCGLWLERDYGKPAKELMQDAEFVTRYVVDLALGLKAAIRASCWASRPSFFDSLWVMVGTLRALATITWWPSGFSKRLIQAEWLPHSTAMRRRGAPAKCRRNAASVQRTRPRSTTSPSSSTRQKWL